MAIKRKIKYKNYTTYFINPLFFSSYIFANHYEIIDFAKGYLKADTTIYPKFALPINIYFVIDPSNQPATTTTLANSLYGMMSYTKNGSTDPNEDIYSGYGVNFSSKKYAHPDWKDSYDLVIFGVDMSDSKHAENKKNSILVTGKNDLKINNTTIQPEAELKKNCFQGCVLGVHYNDVTDSLSLKG